MEKGGDGNSGSAFGVLDKKTSSNSGFLSWMKLQQSTSSSSSSSSTHPFPSNFLMMGLHHHQTHPFLGDAHDGGAANDSAAPAVYCDQVSSSDGGGAGNFGKNTSVLQSSDIFHPSYSTTHYKSPGGGMATEFPFTAGQWKELERQAMIYKCMISSVPVPPHLLFPLSTNFPLDPSAAYGGGYSRKGDPEPGRCKRTDGKKWRCSREVAPLQKYCERHLHRGRPRSRKPVEVKNNNNKKKTRLDQTKKEPLPLLKAKTDLTISTPPYYKPTTNNNSSRDLGCKQPWEDLMEANMGIQHQDYTSSYDQDYSALNLFSYPNFPTPEMELAWSIDSRSSAAVSPSEGDLSPSLNLSMSTAVAPLSWEPFARGGPLGEALQPSNPASPYNSMSTPVTTVSSPTGVLHWTLFSNSDGSVCNSPTLAAEISNHWHI